MRTAILLSNPWPGIGGAENTVGCMAEAMESLGSVDIIHGKDDLDLDLFRDRFGVRLERTRLLKNWPPAPVWELVHNPMKRMRIVREAYRPLSDGYDVFIAVTHSFPPIANARLNILHLLFPFDTPESCVEAPARSARSIKDRMALSVKMMYHRYELGRRLASYDLLTVNSQYTADWSRRRWGGNRSWRIWYPPVTLVDPGDRADRPKSILAVGRICADKYPLSMVGWFRQLAAEVPEASLSIAGSTGPATKAHHDALLAEAVGLNLRILANISHDQLHGAYQSSAIFWHTMGYAAPEEKPERFEHFGMTTVEAMSAGCVPVVYGRGGQAEIIEHGVNGFTWTQPAQLIQYTKQLLNDSVLRLAMSRAAIERSRQYSKQIFQRRLIEAVKQRLSDSAEPQLQIAGAQA